ncbi:hypothetical protein AAVH_40905, partial [Aphelenchoides avenae]
TRDNAWALCGRGPWPLLPVGDAVLLHLKQNSTTSTRERWFKFDVNGHPGCGDALRNALIRKLSVQSDGNDIDRQCAMAAMRHLRCPFGVYEQICRRSETTWGDIHLSAIVDCGVKRFLYHTSEEDLLELAEAGEFRSPFVRRIEGILFVVKNAHISHDGVAAYERVWKSACFGLPRCHHIQVLYADMD